VLKNYLKITLRNLARSKLFTFINIFGMSVSLACCIILFVYTTNELSFDSQHGNDVYRLTSTLQQKDGELFKIATSSVPIAPVIKEEVPEIEEVVRMTGSSMFGGKNIISYRGNNWFIEDGYICETSVFSILKYQITNGNKLKPLTHHNGIVLEKSWAKTLFGDEDPIQKMVKLSTNFGTADFEVTAVYDKSYYKSHVTPTFFISMSNNQWNSFFNEQRTNWVGNNMVFTYLKLRDGSDPNKVDDLIHEIFLKNGSDQMKAMGVSKEMDLQAVREIHTDTNYMINVSNTTNLTFIYVLGTIGVLIMVLACVNYINLSTARAGKRALEVGVRKVMGVTPGGLIWQFLGEAIILVSISMFFGIFIAQLGVPFFNLLISNPIDISWEILSEILPYLVVFLFMVGLFSGFYPAFYLSSLKPHAVLKGRGNEKSGSALLRRSLVVFQFVISISLISSIMIISNQVDYIKHKDLGFSSDSKLIIPLSGEESSGEYKNLKTLFESNAAVRKVSGSNSIPGGQIVNDLLVYKDGQTMEDAIHIYNNTVDLEYAQLLDLELLSGTYFLDHDNDSLVDKVLISKEGIDQLGISVEEAPGQIIHFDWEGRVLNYEIVGVVDDIHQFSLHQTMDPLLYTIGDGEAYGYMTIDANLDDFQGLVTKLNAQWDELIVETPFEYYELNDHLLLQYTADFNTFSLIRYFAFISILISCLGLYAMSLFMAEKRYREIGIRKTFGAGIGRIFTMVSSDLSRLIVVAFVLSIPITWYGMGKWLESFAYKIEPGLMVYLYAGIISIFIGWITIGYQSIKAARTNPIDVLKEE